MTDTLPAPTTPVAPAYEPTPPAPAPAPAKGFAITSLVLGIVAMVFVMTFILGQYGAVLGIVAAVFGFIAARKNKRNGLKRGMARAGMTLGIIAVPLGFATAAMFVTAVDDVLDEMDSSFTVLEAEWHLEGEYNDFANDVDTTATAGDVVDGVTTIRVTETGTANVLAEHQVQINEDGTFVILD